MIKYVAALMLLSGCVTAIPLSSEETCSLENMALAGVSIGGTSSSAIATGQYGNNVYVNSQTNTRELSCRPAQTHLEKCGISAHQKAIAEKGKFNSTVSSKRFLTGLGYAFYFLPGAFVNSHFEGQKNEAIESSGHVFAKEKMTCEKDAPRLPTNSP